MMRKICVLTCLFSLSMIASAGDGDYAVTRIPANLLENANAVIRDEELRFEVISSKEAVHNYRYVITVLNENGDSWAQFSEYYDKMREISSVEGILFDASGKMLKKMKTKDLMDLSGTDDNNLMDDNRVKRHNFYYKVYPYTISYEVEVRYKSTLFFPVWIPQGDDKISVEKSRAIVITPANYQLRYKAFRYEGNPVVTTEKNKQLTTWTIGNMPALMDEPYQPQLHERTTMVIYGPSEFQVDSYKGNMQSWQDFGKFIYSLKQGRDELPEEVKRKVQEIVSSVSDTRRKVELLYQYMQKTTRYISIQLGIGGWQPFDAKFVAAKSYGDCKALTNYMYSLLKQAGINSAYTVVRAGDFASYITDDFPSQQFNHVILCVPMQSDTMWLECTSQTNPAGYLGGFTGNRLALFVDENGGKLVRTPTYGLKENTQLRKVRATIKDNGALQLNAHTSYGGMQQDDIHGLINALSKDKVKEYLNKWLDFATYDIAGFDYKENKGILPTVDETLDINVSNYATLTGKRLFIIPNVMTRNHRKLTADENRKYDLVLQYQFRDIDSVEIEIPPGYGPESIPQDVTINSKFGSYSNSIKLKDNKLYYYRKFDHFGGRFAAKEYNELVKFYETVYKADRNRVVLVKGEEKKEEVKKAF